MAAAQPCRHPHRSGNAAPPHRRGTRWRAARRPQVGDVDHPALFQSDRAQRPELPDPAASHPAPRGRLERAGRTRRPLRGGFPHAGAGPGPPLPRPGVIPGHRPLRLVLPLLHALTDGLRGGRSAFGNPVGSRLPLFGKNPASPRRVALRRRSPAVFRRAARQNPHPPARHPPHPVPAHRQPHPGVPAPAHHPGTVCHAQKAPPAVHFHPHQPPARTHRRSARCARPPRRRRHPARQPKRAAARRQRFGGHPTSPASTSC